MCITCYPTTCFGITDIFCAKINLYFIRISMREIYGLVDLMDASGNLLDYQQFCTKHKFNPSKSDFIKLHKALPQEFVFLTKNILAHQPIIQKTGPIVNTRDFNPGQKM